MALPIAPTPVLTGKSAIALARYTNNSEKANDKLFGRKVDIVEIDRLIEKRNEKHITVEIANKQGYNK